MKWYEKLYNIGQHDVWGGLVHDLIAPTGRDNPIDGEGINHLEFDKY